MLFIFRFSYTLRASCGFNAGAIPTSCAFTAKLLGKSVPSQFSKAYVCAIDDAENQLNFGSVAEILSDFVLPFVLMNLDFHILHRGVVINP